jgi:3-mercaptopyruvate sulfurtransferase SseA
VQEFAAARLTEAEHAARGYLGDVAALEPVAQEELSRWLRDGQVLVLDVRPETEYAAGHIPGAVNVPHDQPASRDEGRHDQGDQWRRQDERDVAPPLDRHDAARRGRRDAAGRPAGAPSVHGSWSRLMRKA